MREVSENFRMGSNVLLAEKLTALYGRNCNEQVNKTRVMGLTEVSANPGPVWGSSIESGGVQYKTV